MDFISSIFNPIVQLLEFILGIFHDFLSTVGLESYGVAIIVLTIIIKMAFYPLTVKQVKSMKAMQELQPKMKNFKISLKMTQNDYNRKWVCFIKCWGKSFSWLLATFSSDAYFDGNVLCSSKH